MDFSRDFKEWLQEKIAEALDNYSDTSVYGCDLVITLFEGENVNGSILFNTEDAKEFIKDHWDDAGEIHTYLKENLEMVINPFDEPEKFHVCMLLEGAREMLNNNTSELLNEYWNDHLELTDASIAILKSDIGIDTGLESQQLAVLRDLHDQEPELACDVAESYLNELEEKRSAPCSLDVIAGEVSVAAEKLNSIKNTPQSLDDKDQQLTATQAALSQDHEVSPKEKKVGDIVK